MRASAGRASFDAAALNQSKPAVASIPAKSSSIRGKSNRLTILFGQRTVASSVAGVGAGVARAFPFRSRITGTASSITVYLDQRSHARTLFIGMYSSVHGRPGGRLTTGSIRSPKGGAWNSTKVRRADVKSGATYWLVMLGKGGALYFRHRRSTACAAAVSYKLKLASLPATWTGGTLSRTCQIAANVKGSARSLRKKAAGFTTIGTAGIALTTGFGRTQTGGVLPPVNVTQQPIAGPPQPGSTPENCLSQLQVLGSNSESYGTTGVAYPVWSQVIGCGYPAPTSVDPIGASNGTAGVPANVGLQNAATCGCLPSGDDWNPSGYLFVGSSATLSDLYVPGTLYIASTGGQPLTIQDVNVDAPPNGSAYAVNGNGNGNGSAPITIENSWIHSSYTGQSCDQNSTTSDSNVGIGNFGKGTLGQGENNPDLILINDDVDCFGGQGVNNSNVKITGSVLTADGTIGPIANGHYEPIYTGHDDYIVGNTIINPEINTAEIFGDQNCSSCLTLVNDVIENNLLAGNQNNGGLAMGCTANGSTPPDFGHAPNVNIVIENNRFTTAYNAYWGRYAPSTIGAAFSAGNTDGLLGTTWSGDYFDNNLATVPEPAHPC